jgi:predicted RNA binding protein YcfA (HicA-like mRNA interferase family)
MARMPRLTGREVIAALAKAGVEVLRVKGSHHFPRRPDGRTTVVPLHSSETIGPGLMARILSDCEMTQDELQSLL